MRDEEHSTRGLRNNYAQKPGSHYAKPETITLDMEMMIMMV